jgi:hypothetical protein
MNIEMCINRVSWLLIGLISTKVISTLSCWRNLFAHWLEMSTAKMGGLYILLYTLWNSYINILFYWYTSRRWPTAVSTFTRHIPGRHSLRPLDVVLLLMEFPQQLCRSFFFCSLLRVCQNIFDIFKNYTNNPYKHSTGHSSMKYHMLRPSPFIVICYVTI